MKLRVFQFNFISLVLYKMKTTINPTAVIEKNILNEKSLNKRIKPIKTSIHFKVFITKDNFFLFNLL